MKITRTTTTLKPNNADALAGISCTHSKGKYTKERKKGPLEAKDFGNTEGEQSKYHNLERLLTRDDIWRGLSAPFPNKQTISSGYKALDKQLNGGWPLATLIDITSLNKTRVTINSKKFRSNKFEEYTKNHTQDITEDHTGINCLLFASAIKNICQNTSYWALLNPPNQPYAPGLGQHNLPIDKLLIIKPKNKNDFIACFIELCRSKAFPVVMAWAPTYYLNYSELRKLHLASQKTRGLYLLFRSTESIQQPSPAGLRLSTHLKKNTFQVNIIKQKNSFIEKNIEIPLPKTYLSYVSHGLLGQKNSEKRPKNIRSIKNIHYLYSPQ